MRAPLVFRRAIQALLPATLLLAACSKSDTPAPTPAPDQGKVLVSHAAAAANSDITAFVNDQQVGVVKYGQNTSYSSVNAGSGIIRINNGTQSVATLPIAISKDQSYSAFAYSPTASVGSATLLVVPDDLSAPTTVGAVKIRLVHLGVNSATPVRLSIASATPGGNPNDLTGDVAFGAASAFILLNAGPQNLVVTAAAAPRNPVAVVGDGTGAGTGSKTFEAGKIYTVVVRGIAGTGVPAAQQIQATIIQNN